MASPLRKESFNCTSPSWQDRNQEQKSAAQKVLFGNMFSFRLKETKTSKGDGNATLCKKEKAVNSGFFPWMGKVLKSVSRSLFSLSKQRTSAKVSEADTAFFEKAPIDRQACSNDDKPKVGCLMENHLKLLFNSLQGNAVSHHLRGCSAKAKVLKSEDFAVGVLLFQPLENSNLAQGLSVGVKEAGLQKPSVHGFARLQGEPTIIYSESSHVEEPPRSIDTMSSGESQTGSPLRLHGMQFTSFLDRIPAQAAPDKEKLNSVQDFFLYAETEGKRVFEELDKDKDGKISANDISAVMLKMKLPSSYARKFMNSRHKPWPVNSMGWTEFASLMQEKEPTIIRLFNSLGISKHGTIHRAHVKHFLTQHSFSVSDSTITAMMEAVGGEKDSVKYGQFRKFMLLIPTEQLKSDPWSVWFTAATVGAESEVSRGSVFNHVTLLSRSFVRHLDAAKGKVVAPDLPRVEELSEFIRSTVKHVIHEPFTRLGADVPKIGG